MGARGPRVDPRHAALPYSTGPGLEVTKAGHTVGRQLGASGTVMLAGFEAGWVESPMNNLDCGDKDSLGVFQQRPGQGWGTPEQIRDVAYAAGMFFRHAVRAERRCPDLTAGGLTQAVQRSARPDRYDEAEGTARELLEEARRAVGDARECAGEYGGGAGRLPGAIVPRAPTGPGRPAHPLRARTRVRGAGPTSGSDGRAFDHEQRRVVLQVARRVAQEVGAQAVDQVVERLPAPGAGAVGQVVEAAGAVAGLQEAVRAEQDPVTFAEGDHLRDRVGGQPLQRGPKVRTARGERPGPGCAACLDGSVEPSHTGGQIDLASSLRPRPGPIAAEAGTSRTELERVQSPPHVPHPVPFRAQPRTQPPAQPRDRS